MRRGLIVGGLLLLSGCGLAGTGASAVTSGTSELQQARDAKAIEARVRTQVEAAEQAAAQQRAATEAANP